MLTFAKLLRFSRAERDARIAQVLHLMEIQAAASDLVSHYSGGMVRRLEIGQAILHRPHVLILDEPTVGLDPIARHSVWQALEELRGTGRGRARAAQAAPRPTELLTRAIEPALWLLIFGQAFSAIRAIPTDGVSYLAFMTPGILAQSVLFISIFYGLTVISDRDQGILQKFLVMPVPRASFVTGKALGAGVRALSQAGVVLGLAVLLGVQIDWSLLGVLGTLAAVVIGAAFFATVSMLLAIAVKTRERFMGTGQVITMPLFFASNAIYALQIMPAWPQTVALANPLSYLVDLLRGYLVTGAAASSRLDWLVLLVALGVLQVLAAATFKTTVI